MSSVSLSLRALSKRPAAVLSSSRTFATTVETPSISPSDPSPSTHIEKAPSPDHIPRVKLPTSTPAPTPYHAFVHVPLLPFTTATIKPQYTALSPAELAQGPQIVPLPSTLFNTPSRPSLLHKLIISHLASLRTGNASTKNRSEVNYSGKKIRPQKGTGKARLGSRGSPMLTGGGRAFGPRPKGPDGWNRKVNRRELRLGLRVGLSDKWRAGDLCVVDGLRMNETSTRSLKARLETKGWGDALFVMGKIKTEEQEREKAMFELAARNLDQVHIVSDAAELGIWELVKRRKVILELSAVDEIIHRIDPEALWVDQANEDDEDWEEDEMSEDDMASELEQALAEHQATL